MIISQSGKVDLIPEYNRALRPIFCVSEGDADSRMINLSVQNAGENFTIPGSAAVYVAGRKKDNTIFTYQCMFSGYIVTFPVSAQMSAEDGIVLCELQIVVNSEPLGSANFVYWVEPSPIENGIASESDLNIFEQAIALLSNFDHFYANVEGMVTEAVGNIQIHEGQTVIDASLSVSGAAADAKATGDKIKELYGAFFEETVTGESVTFDDGAEDVSVKQIVADILPKQDLNGQANPYPPGGGKNLLNITATSGTIGNVEYTVNADGSVKANGTANATSILNLCTFTLPAGDYIANGITGGQNGQYLIRIYSGSTTVKYVYDGDTAFSLDVDTEISIAIYIYNGCTVSNKMFYPMIRLSSVSDGTFAPYSNICPISGYTGVTVTRTGKNLLKNNLTSSTSRGITATVNADGTVTLTGTNDGTDYSRFVINNNFYAVDGIEYILSGAVSTNILIRNVGAAVSDTGNGVSFTGDGTSQQIEIRVLSGTAISGSVVVKPMIRPASISDDTYTPYNAATYPVTFPASAGTVYGGTLTVNDDGSGSIVVDRASITLDGTETWTTPSTSVFSCASAASNCDTTKIWASDHSNSLLLTTNETNTTYYNFNSLRNSAPCAALRTTGAVLISISEDITTVEQCVAWLADNPLQVLYYITPTTYALTAPQVKTLLGDNAISMDADGEMTVTYRANTAIYIEKRIAAIIGTDGNAW